MDSSLCVPDARVLDWKWSEMRCPFSSFAVLISLRSIGYVAVTDCFAALIQ